MLDSLDAALRRSEGKYHDVFAALAATFPVTAEGVSLLVGGIILLVLISGVVLPAVWSRKAHRRKAALEVISQLLRKEP